MLSRGLPFPLPHLVVFVGMVLLSIPIYVIAFVNLVFPIDRNYAMVDAITRLWMRSILAATGTHVPLALKDQLPGPGPYIFMSNHQSHIDVVLLYAKLPITPKFVAKRELLYVPVFGLTMWCLGHITIDRKNRQRAIASLDKAGAKIRGGTSVLIFPEGTRRTVALDQLGDLKKGGFMLAIKAGVPILPIGIAGTDQVMPRGSVRTYPGTVCYRIGSPINTADHSESDRDKLMATVRGAIVELKQQAASDLGDWKSEHH